MTLPVNFIVFGRAFRENGVFIVGARVTVIDQTNNQGTASGLTDANGKFLINVKNYASNGDALRVACSYQREEIANDFILDVRDGTKEVNLNLKLTQTVIHGYGEGPAMYIQCQQCGYNNYYPKPDESYCCHACQVIMDKDGKSGGCAKVC
jgi:hypothetical protein